MNSDPQIMHLVLFKWIEGARDEQIRAVLDGLRGLSVIPGVVELHAGRNFCARSQGFDTALMVRFTNRAALDAYSPHPAHRAVVENLINAIRADSLAVDYEIED
ncbi:MAG: Dabb family protein [Armatimonadetes bacterium]|nr:Dabb family protein [Armatimonadota bacterium]